MANSWRYYDPETDQEVLESLDKSGVWKEDAGRVWRKYPHESFVSFGDDHDLEGLRRERHLWRRPELGDLNRVRGVSGDMP